MILYMEDILGDIRRFSIYVRCEGSVFVDLKVGTRFKNFVKVLSLS